MFEANCHRFLIETLLKRMLILEYWKSYSSNLYIKIRLNWKFILRFINTT